jgi:hypothetical protein
MSKPAIGHDPERIPITHPQSSFLKDLTYFNIPPYYLYFMWALCMKFLHQISVFISPSEILVQFI